MFFLSIRVSNRKVRGANCSFHCGLFMVCQRENEHLLSRRWSMIAVEVGFRQSSETDLFTQYEASCFGPFFPNSHRQALQLISGAETLVLNIVKTMVTPTTKGRHHHGRPLFREVSVSKARASCPTCHGENDDGYTGAVSCAGIHSLPGFVLYNRTTPLCNWTKTRYHVATLDLWTSRHRRLR